MRKRTYQHITPAPGHTTFTHDARGYRCECGHKTVERAAMGRHSANEQREHATWVRFLVFVSALCDGYGYDDADVLAWCERQLITLASGEHRVTGHVLPDGTDEAVLPFYAGAIEKYAQLGAGAGMAVAA